MEARARARFIRIAPRKVRRILDLIRGKETGEALSILRFTPGRASPILQKLLRSALANAKVKKNLYVAQATCDQGPTLPRWRPRAFGRATRIRKRTSHITIVLKEKKEESPKGKPHRTSLRGKPSGQAKVISNK
jgi:large subunit ribosomal protein L22